MPDEPTPRPEPVEGDRPEPSEASPEQSEGPAEGPYAGVRLTREEVERLIAEHGGPEGLDLRGAHLQRATLRRANLQRADLRGANLQGAILERANLQGATLWDANLQGATLWDANLQGAILWGANLQGATLGSANLQGAILERANLQEAFLGSANLQGARLVGANLQGAYLGGANLQGAYLGGANLQGARLERANLQGARLERANLQGATLRGAHLQGADLNWAQLGRARLHGATLGLYVEPGSNRAVETDLANVDWGRNFVLGEEVDEDYEQAEAVYRMLKQWHQQHGFYAVASEFAYRENVARRKARWQRIKGLWGELWGSARERGVLRQIGRRLQIAGRLTWESFLESLALLWEGISGYGQKPLRVFGSGLIVLLLFWLLYLVFGGTQLRDPLRALYFSAVSFVALGYGNWLSAEGLTGWAQGLGAFEALIGVFLIATFAASLRRG